VIFSAVAYYTMATNPSIADEVARKTHWRFVKNLPPPKFLLQNVSEQMKNLPELAKSLSTGVNIDTIKRVIPKHTVKHKVDPEKAITIFLNNGSVMTGELIKEDKGNYIILWEGGQVLFAPHEIKRIVRGKAIEGTSQSTFTEEKDFISWPYQNDLVLHLKNAQVVDAKIVSVGQDKVILDYPTESGGQIEQELSRNMIEYLEYRPIATEQSRKLENDLRKQFTKMSFYQDGFFTIITDSYETWLRDYKKILREDFTDIYLTFFPLFKDRKPDVQNFIVIFDSFSDYFEYALTDGVPAWGVVGYFSPAERVLYTFNSLGDQFSNFIQEAIAGRTGRAVDAMANSAKARSGERYSVFIDGQARSIKEKFWRFHDLFRSEVRDVTTSTLKHEAAHALFNNFGVQTIVVSKMSDSSKALIEKKRKFLESSDPAQKKQLLQEIIAVRKSEEMPEINASNSWFVEGLAAYCETSPIGAQNDNWLYIFQAMTHRSGLYPLEQLTVFRMGSFPGVYPETMMHAYSQSWALVKFLMDRHREPFLKYLRRVAEQEPTGQEDLEWLLEALGMDLKTLQAQFSGYMTVFPQLQDPDIKRLELTKQVFDSF